MNRRKDVFNSPEYRHIEENLDDILKELEEDEETRDLTMPEEWEDDFREILEKVNNEKKQRHRKKLRHTIVAAVVTVAILVPLIGLLGPETVEGEGILALIEKNIFMNGRRYGMSGTEESGLTIDPQDLNEIIFSDLDIHDFNEKINQEITHPFFRVNWVPEGYYVREAVYNKEFDALNIELYNGENYIYISQQTVSETGGQSNVTQDDRVGIVKNSSIGKNIELYKSISDTGISFTIIFNNARIDFYAEISIEDCKLIAKNIEYN